MNCFLDFNRIIFGFCTEIDFVYVDLWRLCSLMLNHAISTVLYKKWEYVISSRGITSSWEIVHHFRGGLR